MAELISKEYSLWNRLFLRASVKATFYSIAQRLKDRQN